MKNCLSPGWPALLVLCLSGALACRIDPEAFEDDLEGPAGKIEFSWDAEGVKLEAVAQGELTFDASDTGLEAISEGGFFSLSEEVGGQTRQWEARPNPDGSLAILYTVNGRPAEMDLEGDRWLAQTLPKVLRETGFDAAARTRRILQTKGVPGVMAEISLIRGGRSRETYIGELLAAAELTEEQLCGLARLAHSGSSAELARMVELLVKRQPGSLALTGQLIETADGISSGSLRRQAIEGILRERDLDASRTAALAGLAAGIRADSEKAEAVLAIAEESPRTPQTVAAFVEAASTIRSSSEKSRVLRELLALPEIDAAVQAKAANAIAGIHSASEKALALTVLAEDLRIEDEAALEAFLEALATVEAPSELERAAKVLLARPDLEAPALRKILAFAGARLPAGPVRERLVERLRQRIDG